MLSSCEKNSRIPRPEVRSRSRTAVRVVLRLAQLFPVLCLAALPVLLSAPLFAKEQPTNVIFVLTDDQGAWALGSYGNPEIRTPNLDALAAGGARFTNAFVTTPVCSPSRATFLTGRIPSQHGIHEWIREENTGPRARQLIADETTLSEILAQRGYAAGISGKWHLGDSLNPQKGFTFWSVMPRGADRYQNARMIRDGKIEEAPGYITEVITDRALEFLEENRKKPFFLWINYSAPHGPWSGHPERLVNLYRNTPFRSIPREGVHPWAIRGASRHIGNRESLAQYFAAVTGIDEGVGRIMAALKRHGLTKRTLVIFASDHGFMVGHKGLWGKGNATQPKNLYDHSLRIPLIFHQPGRIPQALEIGLHVSTYDFFPTVLDYLGITHKDETLAGRSYAPALRGEPLEGPTWNNTVYAEYGLVRGIRTPQWKYVRRYPNGPDELYNLKDDPEEKKNLVNEGFAMSLVERLKMKMEAWFTRYSVPEKDPVRANRDPTIQYRRVRRYRDLDPDAENP